MKIGETLLRRRPASDQTVDHPGGTAWTEKDLLMSESRQPVPSSPNVADQLHPTAYHGILIAFIALLFTFLAFRGFGFLVFLGPGLLGLGLRRLPMRYEFLLATLWGVIFAGVFYSWAFQYGFFPWTGLMVARGLPWILFPIPGVLLQKYSEPTPLKRATSTGLGLALVSLALLLGPTGSDWETPMIALANWPWCLAALPWLGLVGGSLLIGCISGMLLSLHKRTTLFGMMLLMLWAAASAAVYSSRPDPNLSDQLPVAIIQTGWSQDKKWDAESRTEAKQRLIDLTEEAAGQGATLVVWPETSWPYRGMRKRPSDTRKIGRLARRLHIQILASSIEENTDGWVNSVSQVLPTGRFSQEYKKIRLAPFAEHLPLPKSLEEALREREPFKQVGRFVAGEDHVLMEVSDQRFAVLICFESMVPGPARQLSDDVDFLVVVTNDAPMVQEAPKEAHFRSAILRAAQFHKPVIQASNNGVSGFIDPYGRVLKRTEPDFTGPTVLVLQTDD
jgi:apolipoprotein N-acyltransferase